MSVRLVMTTLPPDEASQLVHTLVEERLIACANLLPGARSVYRWEGAVQEESETVALMKTTIERLEALEARLSQIHPYDVPEFIVLPVEGGSKPYLDWVVEMTR